MSDNYKEGLLSQSAQKQVDVLDQMNSDERRSNTINEEDSKEEIVPEMIPDENKAFVNLSDIQNIDMYYENQFLIPNSTRKALIARWDSKNNPKMHVLSKNDLEMLEERGFLEKWQHTVNEIAKDKKKQPMNNNPPLWYRGVWGALRFILLVLLIYVELIICQIFLMNVVIIGLCIWFHLNAMVFTNGMLKNKMYSYRHREFKRFISEQNELYEGIDLIPGKEGKWIEIKLEEEENDSQGDITPGYGAYNPDESFEEDKKNL